MRFQTAFHQKRTSSFNRTVRYLRREKRTYVINKNERTLRWTSPASAGLIERGFLDFQGSQQPTDQSLAHPSQY